MRDSAAQQKLWELERDIFEARAELAEVRTWHVDDIATRYQKNLAMVELQHSIRANRKERTGLIPLCPVKPCPKKIVEQPLFALAEVKKGRKRKEV